MKDDSTKDILNKIPAALKKNLHKNLCVCNEVRRIDIINAIAGGAMTIQDVRKETYATMGMGCCRLQVERLIECLCSPDDSRSGDEK